MAQVKQYFLWQRLWVGRNVATDVSAQVNNNWDYEGRKITCTELSYGYVATDKRLLGVMEYDDAQYSPEVITRMWSSIDPWVEKQITATEAVQFCNECYPAPEGEADYFSLDADGFTIIDNRPVEEI